MRISSKGDESAWTGSRFEPFQRSSKLFLQGVKDSKFCSKIRSGAFNQGFFRSDTGDFCSTCLNSLNRIAFNCMFRGVRVPSQCAGVSS